MVKSKKATDAKPARSGKSANKKFKNRLIPLLFAFGLLVFLVSGIFYYTQVFTKPSNVFWGMIGNNLATKGITRQVLQEEGETLSNEVAQFNFGNPTAVKLTRTISNSENSGNSTKLEGIGLGENDFQRYIKVERSDGSTTAFDPVLNKWVLTGSTDASKGVEKPSILIRSLLGPILSGNLPEPVRGEVVGQLMANNVYTVQFENVNQAKENGHSVYKFDTTVNLKKFVEVMNRYASVMGIPGADTISPETYQEGETIKVVLTVDKRSRQLLKVEYAGSTIKETYSGYGVTSDISQPSEFLTSEEFRQLLGQ